MGKALDGRAEAGPRLFQIFACLRQQCLVVKRAAHRVGAVVQIDLAALAAFQIDQNVNNRAAARHLAHVKRPLVAL